MPGPLRQRFKSRRNGLRDLFRIGDFVYKIYDVDHPNAPHRSLAITGSYGVSAELASEVPAVAPMSGLLLDGHGQGERVVGYWMPFIRGGRLGPKQLPEACRIYLEIDRVLVERGFFWQDPKRSNFMVERDNGRIRVVDTKRVVPLRKPGFDPEEMLSSPRQRKLDELGLSAIDLAQMAEWRERYWERTPHGEAANQSTAETADQPTAETADQPTAETADQPTAEPADRP